MTDEQASLTPAQLATAFPFHLTLDHETRIRAVGLSIGRVLGEHAVGRPFAELFRFTRPHITGTSAEMKQQAGRLVVIESLAEPRIHLRGSILPAEGDVGFFLLLSPWITRLDDIERLGLTLSDFAPHDPVADLLFLHQANTAALDDTRRLAAELRERKDRLATIFSLSPDGFVALGADNRVTYVNEAFTRLTGTTEVQVADATAEQLDALLATRAAPSVPFGGLEIDPPAPEDNVDPRRAQPRHLLQLAIPEPRVLSYSVRHGEGGSKVLYFRDITRETEVDRMKSEFLSTAAHELRTPMASVFGFSELLLKRDYDETTRRDLLSTIHRQAGTLIHLLNELLDLARIEARQGTDFRIAVQPLRPVIEGTAAALLVPNDPRKVTLDLPETPPHCAVDAEKLAQALTNLLSNAYKYSPDGGEIRLDTRMSTDGRKIGIRITDQGLGMTPAQVARCFERFYRADASGRIPGTGLGLPLVKEIVELLGGRIDIGSSPGKGTIATIWLNVAQPEERQG